ncbi:MAG: hypothetical protein QXT31_08310 [Candidatus Bathyarchaeia archaeon]
MIIQQKIISGLKTHKVDFDLFSFFGLIFSISIFIWFMTLIDLNQTIALKSIIGVVIGLSGAMGGFLIVKNVNIQLGISAKAIPKITLILFLSILSLLIQTFVIMISKSTFHLSLVQPTKSLSLSLFYMGMAFWETLFFPFFLYRAFKMLFINIKIASTMAGLFSAFLTSLIFGAYHSVVYLNNLVYIVNAIISNMIFIVGMEATDSVGGAYFPHLLNNLPLSIIALTGIR